MFGIIFGALAFLYNLLKSIVKGVFIIALAYSIYSNGFMSAPSIILIIFLVILYL